jgi:hypothetical protein
MRGEGRLYRDVSSARPRLTWANAEDKIAGKFWTALALTEGVSPRDGANNSPKATIFLPGPVARVAALTSTPARSPDCLLAGSKERTLPE